MLTRYEGLDCLTVVRKEHLNLLRTMHDVGMRWVEKFLQEDASLIFRLGYHSVLTVSTLMYLMYFSSFMLLSMPTALA